MTRPPAVSGTVLIFDNYFLLICEHLCGDCDLATVYALIGFNKMAQVRKKSERIQNVNNVVKHHIRPPDKSISGKSMSTARDQSFDQCTISVRLMSVIID